ncbi:hypothetical protein NDA14_002754 [Ustilago hordei]|uniref:Translation elongation factor EFTs/EF1B dimerisation domain-containing protein n=1 Tax=Ustilago hordei TaxID=120017 RepID=I2FRM4_USTHO|nr:putative Elongation factor Ts, mitochondrial [Ustilago hordei]KAJ1044953.1 hypothetical protein NDA10_005468 [Ustilago hordei]KAJ1571995.1 hypothetical protein NDA15_002329 [Ustilago hordei]KAJ1594383.1 hypothetical protein NDA12_001767 [Ustilago hordei]KAJ1598268.1 hypothetical protein NDA14_002754 [Ustilago hordei]UTT92641.1 hypothetical protein NDA17_001361 [Ustilago hordei]
MMSTSSHTLLRSLRLTATRRCIPSTITTARTLHPSALALEPKKASIKAIAELRKLMPGTSMLKAKEALLLSRSRSSADSDSIPAALAWLECDRKKTGAIKAEKIASRQAREGLIAVTILSDGLPSNMELKSQLEPQAKVAGIGATSAASGAIVEVNCETDFVAKNEVFAQLVKDIVHTVALFPALAKESTSGKGLVEVKVDELLAFPLLPSSPEVKGSSLAPKTVASAVVDVVSRLGEKVSIARAAAILPPTVPAADAQSRSTTPEDSGAAVVELASAFAHGASPTFAAGKDANKPAYLLTSGRVASLLITRLASPKLPDALASSHLGLQNNIRALTRSLARQAAGMQTKSIKSSAADKEQAEVSTALYKQPFIMLLPAAAPSEESNGQSVDEVLKIWASHNKLDADKGHVVEVVDMHRWQLGETAAPQEASGEAFAHQVSKAAGLS